MILMLDIDGVLHPDPTPASEVFKSLPYLHTLLLTKRALRVVVTSDWRLRYSLVELADMLSNGIPAIRDRILDVTPVLPAYRHEYQGREREVEAWLAMNGNPDWLALDDVAGNYTYGSPKVYVTDYRTGLIEADVPLILARVPQ